MRAPCLQERPVRVPGLQEHPVRVPGLQYHPLLRIDGGDEAVLDLEDVAGLDGEVGGEAGGL